MLYRKRFLSLGFYSIGFSDNLLSLLVIVYKESDSLSVKNIFAPVASRVIRCFLAEPKREWNILGLSKVSGVSYGHAHKLVNTLIKLGFCRKVSLARIVVANPAELLSRWASYYDFSLQNEVVAYHSLDVNLDYFVKRLSAIRSRDLRYAVTLHAGAALVAPYVRPANVHLYVESEKLGEWERLLGLHLTELGGNVFLVKPYDEGVFYKVQEVRGARVVSNVQLYVDLYNYPARGREAAEHLRKEAIGF
jgi:hypothetical protein